MATNRIERATASRQGPGDPLPEQSPDHEFCDLVLGLRDTAARLIDRRLMKLFRWDPSEHARVERWFGRADEEMRDYLYRGLGSCHFLLLELTCANFVRYSPDWGTNVGCAAAGDKAEPVAQVCPTDKKRTIAINEGFFQLLRISPSKDSQLSTLIHEVTHFRDTFDSKDLRYGLNGARYFTSVPQLARVNADNLAGYVVEGVVYGD